MLERVLDGMDYAALARIHGLPAPLLTHPLQPGQSQTGRHFKGG